MVGWGWTVFKISCPVVSNFLATTASAIISVTFEPIIWQPSNSPYFSSNITFTKPSLWPDALAFPEAENGNLPILILYPKSIAFFSVNPTEAISGLQ